MGLKGAGSQNLSTLNNKTQNLDSSGDPTVGMDFSAAVSLVNANFDAAAAIAYSKLNLTGNIVDADVNAAAAIAQSKLEGEMFFDTTQVFAGTAPTGAWTDLDLSAVVGSRQATVLLKIRNQEAAADGWCAFRKNGDGQDFTPSGTGVIGHVSTVVLKTGTSTSSYVLIITDAAGIVEWRRDADDDCLISMEAFWV